MIGASPATPTVTLFWLTTLSAYAAPNREQKIFFNAGFCLSEMLNFYYDAKEVKMISGNLIVLARLTSNDTAPDSSRLAFSRRHCVESHL